MYIFLSLNNYSNCCVAWIKSKVFAIKAITTVNILKKKKNKSFIPYMVANI